MKKTLPIFFFINFIIFNTFWQISTCFSQSLVINEILTSNKKNHFDGFGEHDDWVEIYNDSDTIVNLTGMYISDNLSKPTKHQFSPTTKAWLNIPPKSFILLWLDNDPEQGSRHIPFSLNNKKGSIAIYNSDTVLLDQITYKLQKTDVSLGRKSINDSELLLFNAPSPLEANVNGLKIIPDDAKVKSTLSPGFYQKPITISLNSSFDGAIYYTTDGSEPTEKSTIYTQSLKIDSTMVIRSRVIPKGYCLGTISTWTYLINEKSSLPILSLTSDPDNLWKKRKGIYRNYEKRGWEKPAFVEYFEKNDSNNFDLAFTKTVDIRIAGKTSRRQPKKSFAIFSNNTDEKKRIHHKIFKDKPIESYASFWVRADATSGRNVPKLWVGERFKNELLYEVNKDMNGNVDMQAYEPVLLYLNGKFWGLYNLMERKGSDFIANNHGEKKVDILTSEGIKVVKGSMDEYLEMIDYISINNPQLDSVYQYMDQRMDMASYIDYWIFETYCGAHDIDVNIRFWKSKKAGSKWRWISYDQDSWHKYDEASFDYFIGEDGKVFLLEKLMQNQTFRYKFFNRMCDFLNTGLSSENVIKHVDAITNRIASEVLLDKKRWQDTMLYVPQNERIEWIKEYASLRPDNIRQQIISYFGLSGDTTHLVINNQAEGGDILLNSLLIKTPNWKGIYLEDIPIRIEVKPKKGYVFVRWQNRKLGKEAVLNGYPQDFKNLSPILKKNKRYLVKK